MRGCPNQQICAAPKVEEPPIEFNAKRKILILSGKGGVGKSTFSTTLSFALSNSVSVSLIDIDVCGPSVPIMTDTLNERVHQSNQGLEPVYVNDNLSVMSIGYLVGEDDAVIWRGPKKNGIIKQFLRDVSYDQVDVAVFDTPPGTSDEHLSIVQFLKHSGIDGAIIITTPQEIALQDIRKQINFCKKVSLPILGIVENMSFFSCPSCRKPSEIFAAHSGGATKLANDLSLELLGQIPIDPRIGMCCDNGLDFTQEFKETDAAFAYSQIVKKVIAKLNL